jgi:hypothetical protein
MTHDEHALQLWDKFQKECKELEENPEYVKATEKAISRLFLYNSTE